MTERKELRLDWLSSAVLLAEAAETEHGLNDRQRRALASLSARYFLESIGMSGDARNNGAPAPITCRGEIGRR
jgi:hypothetical protein